jgi:hypothetical protein
MNNALTTQRCEHTVNSIMFGTLRSTGAPSEPALKLHFPFVSDGWFSGCRMGTNESTSSRTCWWKRAYEIYRWWIYQLQTRCGSITTPLVVIGLTPRRSTRFLPLFDWLCIPSLVTRTWASLDPYHSLWIHHQFIRSHLPVLANYA